MILGRHHEDEARAYLQARFTLFTRLMFVSFVTLMAFLSAMYQVYPSYKPPDNNWIFGTSAALLGVMLVIWRGFLVRRALSVAWLYRIDLIYAVCTGAALAGSAVLAVELRPAAYMSLVYGILTIFTRAIVVPSSGPRTTAVALTLFAPLAAAGVYLAITSTQELPGPAFAAGSLVFSGVAIALASTGSQIIYGLRRQVSEAMQLGQYTLDRKIGEGGNGAVYRARHALLRRPTAIKLLLPDKVGRANLDRFEREVQHMSELTHPNTVAVFDYGRSPDGVLYYAMEYLAGVDLEHLVRRHGAQPADRVVGILAQVCGALQEAHDAGLIHRDIKPANIILCERGGAPDIAKVVDFGLVKQVAEPGTAGSAILGTPAYLAPEAVTDPEAVGPAADLYGLGAVGFFLLTGRRVFTGVTPLEVCLQHVTAPPPAVPDVAPALAALIARCLAKAPGDRFASAAALGAALAALPAAGDWDLARARAWWRVQRVAPVATEPAGDRATVTIDVARRT